MPTITRRLYRFRNLLATLTRRDLKARYRGSMLGWLWSLVTPLLLLGVYTFVFNYVFRPKFAEIDPYSLFLITGLFPWIWVQTSLLEGTASLLSNSDLLRKATFPAELLPVVPVLVNLVHYLLSLPILGVAFVVAHAKGFAVGGVGAFALPLIVLLQLPMVAGLALGLATLNAHFKDVKDLLANVLMICFFMTPILYDLRMIEEPLLHSVVAANPFTPFVLAYQSALFHGTFPTFDLWWKMVLMSALGWWLGTLLFERLSDTLVEAV